MCRLGGLISSLSRHLSLATERVLRIFCCDCLKGCHHHLPLLLMSLDILLSNHNFCHFSPIGCDLQSSQDRLRWIKLRLHLLRCDKADVEKRLLAHLDLPDDGIVGRCDGIKLFQSADIGVFLYSKISGVKSSSGAVNHFHSFVEEHEEFDFVWGEHCQYLGVDDGCILLCPAEVPLEAS